MPFPRPSAHDALPAQRISRVKEADSPLDPLEDEPEDFLSAGAATLYREYIERLVHRLSLRRVVAAGGQELMNLEAFCDTRGEGLIDGIAPALNRVFDHISAGSPDIWTRFTCADAVSVIRDELGRLDVLDQARIVEGDLGGKVVRAFFLYCSYAWAHAAHESAEVCRTIGIRREPLVN